ncbi:MAG: hypothetical protein O2816_08985, partial [Planctomycetota bacterium]|nr:hypothetical protein [Planctomycetota bacterium]
MADRAANLTTDAPLRPAPLRPMVCFDGDCGMCRGSVELIVRLGLVERQRSAPFQSFDAEVAGKLLEANVHNELAVLDTDTGEIRSGIHGLLWACEGSWLAP